MCTYKSKLSSPDKGPFDELSSNNIFCGTGLPASLNYSTKLRSSCKWCNLALASCNFLKTMKTNFYKDTIDKKRN